MKNEAFWREELARRIYYNPEISWEKYRAALEYGSAARAMHDPDTSFESVAEQLATRWAADQASTGLTWTQVKEAVEEAWSRADELSADAIAHTGGFDEPPTFTDHGRNTPRNLDEPNQ